MRRRRNEHTNKLIKDCTNKIISTITGENYIRFQENLKELEEKKSIISNMNDALHMESKYLDDEYGERIRIDIKETYYVNVDADGNAQFPERLKALFMANAINTDDLIALQDICTKLIETKKKEVEKWNESRKF